MDRWDGNVIQDHPDTCGLSEICTGVDQYFRALQTTVCFRTHSLANELHLKSPQSALSAT